MSDINYSNPVVKPIRRINSSCLIIGAGGFIGFNLCLKLHKHYKHIIACDNYFSEKNLEILNKLGIEIISEGIDGFIFAQEKYNHIEDIFYFAGNSIPALVEQELEKGYFPDQEILVQMLSSLKNMKNQIRFFYGSSGGTIYGESDNKACDETMTCKPISSYGLSKLTQEQYIQFFARKYHFKYYITRISNPYGRILTHNSKSLQGFIDNVIQKALSHSNIEIWGDGTVSRDFIHIHDLVSALSSMAKNVIPDGIYNIGSGKLTSLNEIVSIIESLGYQLNVSRQQSRQIDVKTNKLSNEKLFQATSWQAEIGLREGACNLLECLAEEPINQLDLQN